MAEMNVNVKMVCFDMDGTIADLYGVENWLEMLRAFDPTPYAVAEPMWQMDELAELLHAVQNAGIEVRVITWLSKETTPAYDKAVREAKREWLRANGFPFDHFHGVAYGATKADSVRKYLANDETAILFDDNEKVRKGWKVGEAYEPAEIMEILRGLI